MEKVNIYNIEFIEVRFKYIRIYIFFSIRGHYHTFYFILTKVVPYDARSFRKIGLKLSQQVKTQSVTIIAFFFLFYFDTFPKLRFPRDESL